MQAAAGPSGIRAAAGYAAVLAFAGGTLLDVVITTSGRGVPPSSGASVSHAVIAAGIIAGCAGVFFNVLQSRRNAPDAGRARWINALQLAGIGLMLGALILRGHRYIPPDPPLVGAQILAVLACFSALRMRRRRRRG